MDTMILDPDSLRQSRRDFLVYEDGDLTLFWDREICTGESMTNGVGMFRVSIRRKNVLDSVSGSTFFSEPLHKK